MGIWGIIVSDILPQSHTLQTREKREKYLLFLENFCNSECWDFTPDLLGVNSTQKQRQGLFFFFSPCLYYFPRSHKLLSPNDTALKETGNSEYPSGDLKKKERKIRSVHFGSKFQTAEGCSRREMGGSHRGLADERQRTR